MEYEIRAFSDGFVRDGTLRRKVSPQPIDRAERDQYMADLGGSQPWAKRALAEQVRWPSHGPYLEGLYCDAEGHLLAYRGSQNGVALLDVYRPDETFVGEVKITGFNRSAVFSAESLFMRVISDEELPAVIRYRLE
jgi:hypothetical protein